MVVHHGLLEEASGAQGLMGLQPVAQGVWSAAAAVRDYVLSLFLLLLQLVVELIITSLQLVLVLCFRDQATELRLLARAFLHCVL